MSMMKKLTILITIIVALTVFFLFQTAEQSVKLQSATDPVLIPIKEALLELKQTKGFQKKTKEQQLEQVHDVLEQMPIEYKALKRQYQIALSTLPDITFYGRVIDQHNQPVVEATVYYTGTNTYLSAGGGRGRVQTDEQGYFEIDTEGAELVLGGATHPDIGAVSYEPPNFNTTTTWGARYTEVNFLSSKDKQGIYPTWRDHTEKSRAYIIRAWRVGLYAGAKEGEVNGFFDADGKYYTLVLNRSNNQQKEGKTKGHLHISCTRSHMENNKDYGDWSLSIAPVNGGIQESDDLYMNLAPETGYQSSIDIVMRKGSPDYVSSLLNKHYYFKSNNGKEYGSLFIHIEPFATVEREACALFIKYKINPTGSRNLELKRKNTSQPKLPSSQSLASN